MNQLTIAMRSIINQCYELCYYMRGSISYTETMHMSVPERDMLMDFVNKRLKDAMKMPNPVF